MKKTVTISAALLICLAMTVMLPLVAFADEDASAKKNTPGAAQVIEPAKAFRAAGFVADDDAGNFIELHTKDRSILYKGQKLNVSFSIRDTWSSYRTIPDIVLFRENADQIAYDWATADPYWIVDPDRPYKFTGRMNVKSGKLKAGVYYLSILAMPCDDNGKWIDGWSSLSIPLEACRIRIKKLPKPTNVRLKAGRRRVTIRFRKSTGAGKYEIYRSLKKNRGYKKIATIKGNKYVARKLKKGKRYYFKVRARRGTAKTGIARSFFTAPKRSRKVK